MKYRFWFLIGFVVLLAACTNPVDLAKDSLNALKANAIGTAISQDTTEVLDSMTLANLSSSAVQAQILLGCVEVSGDVSDIDFDLVPQNAVFGFKCSAIGRYGVQASLTGQVSITDPSSDSSIQGFDSALNKLTLNVIGMQDTSYNETRNGTRSVRYKSSVIDYSQSLAIDRTFVLVGIAGTAKIDNNLNYRFEASEGESLNIVSGLPRGRVSVTGKFDWLSAEDNLSFTLSTPQALEYDASCQTAPLFSSGELRAGLLSSSAQGYIRIVYQGCGIAPEIRFIALP